MLTGPNPNSGGDRRAAAKVRRWLMLALVVLASAPGIAPGNAAPTAPPVPGAHPARIGAAAGPAIESERYLRVAAPRALCSAVSEPGSALVLGCTGPGGGGLLVYKLDAKGAPAPGPTRVALPKPASMAAFNVIPMAMAAHPRLALIYVWVDVVPADGKPAGPPAEVVYRDVDRLLIYAVEAGGLKLLRATARGTWFGLGLPGGALVIDAAAKTAADDRLYLPNLQILNQDPKYPVTQMFGYTVLGVDGQPTMKGAALAMETWPDMSTTPTVARPLGLVAASKQVVIHGVYLGMATTVLERPGMFTSVLTEGSNYPRVCGHPSLSMVYGVTPGTYLMFCVEHVEGYLTMIPQQVYVEGMNAQSAPVVDPKTNKVVIGGTTGLHLVALNKTGFAAGTQERIVTGQPVATLVYSARFDRIYFPVEKAP